ncbi:hypothetical protein [Kibdelosporangium persicum]|nr:hypothetical protein [Kibdelosporangium persicum]
MALGTGSTNACPRFSEVPALAVRFRSPPLTAQQIVAAHARL